MHFYFLSFYFILFLEKVTFSSHPLSLACALLPICSAVMHKQDNPSGFSNKSYNPFTSKWVIKSSGVKWRGPRASVPYSGPCVLEPRARGDRIRVPVWNSELERGGKRRKVWETSVWRGGEGTETEGVGTDCRTNPHSSRLLELLGRGPSSRSHWG